MTHEHDTETMDNETCGENCGCNGGECAADCNCEQETDGAQYLMHKAKMKVLLEKLSAHINKEHGAEYEKLAKLLFEVAHDQSKNNDALQKKRDSLNEQFSKLFN